MLNLRQNWPRRLCWILLVALISLSGGPVRAESAPIRADVLPLAIRSRSNAPVYIDVKLQTRQQAILEGILEIRVLADGASLYKMRTRELAVGPAGMTQRLLLPPGSAEQVAHLRFLGKKGEFDLGRFPLDVSRTTGRQYLIAVCGSASDGSLRLWQALRPDEIVSDSSKPDQIVRSAPVFFALQDLPSAIGLCAFDLLVLEGQSFASLEEKQLVQIGTWVQAGGSLCVTPSSPLSATHLAFLNQLAEKKNQSPAIALESDGRLTFRNAATICSRPGLGRLAIISNVPSSEEEMAAAAWKEIASFLARSRADPDTKVPPDKTKVPAGYVASATALTQSTLFGLLPTTMRMVPASFVITLLGVFVILVGPGEWLILGRLRKRRWTWITFPLFSFTFAAIAIRAAEHYLGRADRRAAAIVTDLGPQGRVLRQNRLDLRFAGRDSTAVMTVQQGLCTPCQVTNDGPLSEDRSPLYQGSLTGHYTVTERLKQWQPRLQRTLFFDGDSELPKIDWDQVDTGSLSSQGLEPLRPWISALRAQGWNVQFMQGAKSKMLDQRSSQTPAHRELVDAISQIRTPNRASWAATIAPTGQSELTDLAVFDPSNPQEWLVVATKSSQQTLHIVRRLYIHE